MASSSRRRGEMDTSYELSWLVDESTFSPRASGTSQESSFRMALLEVITREGIMSVLKQLADDLSHSRSSRRLKHMMQSNEIIQQLSQLREEQNNAVRNVLKAYSAVLAERDDACTDREAAAKDLDALLRSLDTARTCLVRVEYHARSLLHLPEARGLRVVLDEMRNERAPLPVFGGATQALAVLASPNKAEEGAGGEPLAPSPPLARHSSVSVSAEVEEDVAGWSPRRVDAEKQRRSRAIAAVRELLSRAAATPPPAPPLHAELSACLEALCTDAEQLTSENRVLREALAAAAAKAAAQSETHTPVVPRGSIQDEGTMSPSAAASAPEWRVRMLRQKTALQKALGQARDQRDSLERELHSEIQKTARLKEELAKERERGAKANRERVGLYRRLEELELKVQFGGERPAFVVPVPRPRHLPTEGLREQLSSCEAYIQVLERRLRRARVDERRHSVGAAMATSTSTQGTSPTNHPEESQVELARKLEAAEARIRELTERLEEESLGPLVSPGGAASGLLDGSSALRPETSFETRVRNRFAAAATGVAPHIDPPAYASPLCSARSVNDGSGSTRGSSPVEGTPAWAQSRLRRAEAHIRSLLQSLSDALNGARCAAARGRLSGRRARGAGAAGGRGRARAGRGGRGGGGQLGPHRARGAYRPLPLQLHVPRHAAAPRRPGQQPAHALPPQRRGRAPEGLLARPPRPLPRRRERLCGAALARGHRRRDARAGGREGRRGDAAEPPAAEPESPSEAGSGGEPLPLNSVMYRL